MPGKQFPPKACQKKHPRFRTWIFFLEQQQPRRHTHPPNPISTPACSARKKYQTHPGGGGALSGAFFLVASQIARPSGVHKQKNEVWSRRATQPGAPVVHTHRRLPAPALTDPELSIAIARAENGCQWQSLWPVGGFTSAAAILIAMSQTRSFILGPWRSDSCRVGRPCILGARCQVNSLFQVHLNEFVQIEAPIALTVGQNLRETKIMREKKCVTFLISEGKIMGKFKFSGQFWLLFFWQKVPEI